MAIVTAIAKAGRGPEFRAVVRSLWVVLVLAVLALMASGCYTKKTGEAEIPGIANFKLPAFPGSGAHAIEVFTEMHYQPWHRVQEGPRLLPPPDSVPRTGREIIYDMEGYKQLDIPAKVLQDYDSGEAAALFQVNCVVCHGVGGRGDGPMTAVDPQTGKPRYLVRGALPADLVEEAATARSATPGELFGWISFGSQSSFIMAMVDRELDTVMPRFGKLLTETERWTLVVYLRELQGIREQ